jgi:periplasmic copper chaperone A
LKAIGRVVGVCLAAVLLIAPAAGAHVTLQPEELVAGDFSRVDVRVPNERDNASTTKVVVQMPPGFLFVSSEPVPGWNAEIKMRKLDKPVEQFGEQITEEVDTVTFTADGEANAIGPQQFQDFGLSVGVPDKAGTLTFKAIQTYSNGEVVRWIGAPDSESPAPQVQVAAAPAEEGGATAPAEEEEPAAAAPASDESDDGGSDTLAIIALIVGAAALLVGLFALFGRGRGRDRTPTPPREKQLAG